MNSLFTYKVTEVKHHGLVTYIYEVFGYGVRIDYGEFMSREYAEATAQRIANKLNRIAA